MRDVLCVHPPEQSLAQFDAVVRAREDAGIDHRLELLRRDATVTAPARRLPRSLALGPCNETRKPSPAPQDGRSAWTTRHRRPKLGAHWGGADGQGGTAPSGTAPGRAHPRGRAGGARDQPRLRGAGRELPRRAGRPICGPRRGRARDLPLRGGRRAHGRGRRQAHGTAGRRHGHARARRLPRRHRRPRGAAGRHAAAALRRPDPLRRDRPRQLPGGGLPPHVRPAREVGDADRRRKAHPRAGRPRRRCGDERAARPGGDRALGGDAEDGCRRARPRPDPGSQAAARPGSVGAPRRNARAREAAARDPRWLRLERRRARGGARRAGRARPARGGRVPAPGPLRRHAPELRGRPRRRQRPGARRQGARGGPRACPGHAAPARR